MEFFYNRSKFSDQLFYNKIKYGKLQHLSDAFIVSIVPFINYSGKYFIHSVAKKDSKRTIYLTMKSDDNDFDLMNSFNRYYISLSYDSKKLMIFKEDMNGIILKY